MIYKKGCLLIHGFGGNVGEVQYLADYLKKRDYYVKCPTLEGHTGRRRDFVGVGYSDWIKSAEEDYIRLKDKCEKIFIIGFSMGGLIAFNLCEKYDVDALVTINTPIYYWNIRIIFENIITDLKKQDFIYAKKYLSSSAKFPVAALYNFRRLLWITKPKISTIKCPILITQANSDDTVHRKSAKYIYDKIGSEHKVVEYYDCYEHVILTSSCAQEVSEDVEKFVEKIYQGN